MIKNIDRQDCTVYYDLLDAENAQAVAFLHGYGVDRSMWQSQVDVLTNYKVINIDIRGHGQSQPSEHFSIHAAAQDLRAILETEHSENAILIGLSMGGYVVQEYAAEYGGARGYWLIGSTPMFLPCYAAWEKLSLKYVEALMKLYPWNTLKDTIAKSSTYTPEAQQLVRPMIDKMEKSDFIRFWDGVATCLYERDVTFDAPLMFSRGEQDVQGTVKLHTKDWQKGYPDCEIKLIPNAAHIANLDNPTAFNQIMLEFIQKCSS